MACVTIRLREGRTRAYGAPSLRNLTPQMLSVTALTPSYAPALPE